MTSEVMFVSGALVPAEERRSNPLDIRVKSDPQELRLSSMRFEYCSEVPDGCRALAVDGLVSGATRSLSHWAGNATPVALKADTSTEIVLNHVAFGGADRFELVVNNHYDTDGLLSVWCAMAGPAALEHRTSLIAAAEAGDFAAYPAERAVRLSLALQGDAPDGPRARSHGDEAVAYAIALPMVPALLRDPDVYEALWRPGWERVQAAMESFAAGRSSVDEDERRHVSVVVLDASLPGGAHHPTLSDGVTTAIAHRVSGEWIAIGQPTARGWRWRVERAFHAWAETVVRPTYPRRAAAPAAARLQSFERSQGGRWRPGRGALGPALVFTDDARVPGDSSLDPAALATILRAHFREAGAAHAPP